MHWRLPVYQTILGILTNPVYAGAYAYGQTTSRVKLENGRKRVTQGVRVAREDWPVLILDHHEGYIGWGEYEANQRTIAENAAMKRSLVRGPVREGSALLAGLLRCGHCGRKLHVSYSGRQSAARYHCRGAMGNHGVKDCGVSFGSLRVELAVADKVLRVRNRLVFRQPSTRLDGAKRRLAEAPPARACPGAGPLRGRASTPAV